ncbi:hypothetical protein HC717_08730 [Listeria ivanovii subsp. ivanovii]|nr:hypothetical protein [Listeria ivanovii subsp. ivanovii]
MYLGFSFLKCYQLTTELLLARIDEIIIHERIQIEVHYKFGLSDLGALTKKMV